MPVPATLSVVQGTTTNLTVSLAPVTDISGWTLEFRAVANAVNPRDLWTEITVPLEEEATEMIVAGGSDFPHRNPFFVRVDQEILRVTTGPAIAATSRTNHYWVVERGRYGTTAVAHERGARVSLFERPQLLFDNGSNGGLIVEDEASGLIRLEFLHAWTEYRPPATYSWVIRRTDSGYEREVCSGLLYLLPGIFNSLGDPPYLS